MTDLALFYYSRTGVTRQAAQTLAGILDCPLFEVADADSRAGFLGDLRCVMDNLLGRKVPYRYVGPPLSACGQAVVMAPVWVGRLAAPMRSFLADQGPQARGVAAITVMAGRGGFRAAEEVGTLTGHPPHPVLVLLQREIVDGEANPDLKAFAETLRHPQTDTGQARPAWLSPNEA
ncbi:MAG: flavodoxin family protein [Cupriavidus sp.]|nr:MAG: flavodoxin family protein [Cupriavidus sp.]